MIAENQSVVFAKQSVVYISNVKNKAKKVLKRVGIERLTHLKLLRTPYSSLFFYLDPQSEPNLFTNILSSEKTRRKNI